MLQDEDLSSDTSDEDYVAGVGESDNEVSEDDSGQDCPDSPEATKKKTITKKKVNPLLTHIKESTKDESLDQQEEYVKKDEAKQKEKDDNLWADFLADVDDKPAPPKVKSPSWASLLDKKKSTTSSSTSAATTEKVEKNLAASSKPATIKVTKIFEFAGEEVRLTEEVAADSKEAKDAEAMEIIDRQMSKGDDVSSLKKPSGGAAGLLSILNNKKRKLSVLDKTKMDWNNFKSEEGLQEELELHKKSKSGYLEKQAFLERADVRQFEIEKAMRMNKRTKR